MNPPDTTGETNLSVLLKSMKPSLNEGEYVFASVSADKLDQIPRSDTICEFEEKEGITVVMEKQKANRNSLQYDSVFAWITLEIHSSLDAIGLTAAFSNELADKQISCNVIAGYYHDHIFVGAQDGHRAMEVLQELAAKHA